MKHLPLILGGAVVVGGAAVWYFATRNYFPTTPGDPPTTPEDGWPGWIAPIAGQVGSGWWDVRNRTSGVGTHEGIDFWANIGTPVHAVAAGVVTGAFMAPASNSAGLMITVDHGNGLTSRYLHLSQMDVQTGTQVAQGQVIGLSGEAGVAHLHFDVRATKATVDKYAARFGTPDSGFPKKSDGMWAVPAEALVPADYSAAVVANDEARGVVTYG